MSILKKDVQNISNSYASIINIIVGEIETNVKFEHFGVILQTL